MIFHYTGKTRCKIMKKLWKYKEHIFASMAFLFFLFVSCHKLLNASLWFDETIEYWYSKYFFGPLPFENSASMYDRIVSTYQPPLYNVVMYFWLKICDTEWWFRFFGVVMGLLGMFGIYGAIKKLSNSWIASIGVLFSSTIFQLVYYWQECAEYCLMLALMCWLSFFWICLFQTVTCKNIVFFTILAVLAVYSQYGAAFPVISMALIAFLFILCQKDSRKIVLVSASYLCAFIFAALPLYFLFLKEQVIRQQRDFLKVKEITYSGGFFKDFFDSFQTVFKWSFLSGMNDKAIGIVMSVIVLLVMCSFVFGKIKLVKYMILFNMITWLVYYFSVKAGMYSYGSFGNRYNLFFVPIWIILGFAVGIDFYFILKEHNFFRRWNIYGLQYWFVGIGVCIVFCYGGISWTEMLWDNWEKEDIRSVVETWYSEKGYEKDTLIYHWADSGFAFYIRQNSRYNRHMEEKITYMKWQRDKSVKGYMDYLNEIYTDDWPQECYLVASHFSDDLNALIECFISKGYDMEEVYNTYQGKLIYMVIDGN